MKNSQIIELNKNTLNRLFEECHEGVIITNETASKIFFVNSKASKLLGFTKKEITEKKFGLFCKKNCLKTIVQDNKNEKFDGVELLRKDRKKIYCDINTVPIKLNDKKIIIIFLRDFTERSEIEKRYNILVESSPDCIKLFDLNGDLLYINKGGLKEHYLKSNEETISKKWNILDTITDEGKDKFKQAFKEAVNGKISVLEINHNPKGSKNEACLELLAPVKDNNGKIINILGVSRDITEIRAIERDLEKNRGELDAVVDNIGDGVLVIDNSKKIILFNKVISTITGVKPENAIGNKYDKIIKLTDSEKSGSEYDFIENSLLSKKILKSPKNILLTRKNGNKIPIGGNSAPLINKEGVVVGCIIVLRDIAREREIDRIKTEFISIASHQIRTPLSGVKWFTEMLLEEKVGNLNEKQKKFLNQIHTSNEQLINLVKDLLDVSHIDSKSNFKLNIKRVDAENILDEVLTEMRFLIQNKDIKIKKVFKSPANKTIKADREKIKQAFYNLINNAIKFSSDSSTIEVGCSFDEKENKKIFFVRDYGVGIPKKQQKNVFDKFFRASNIYNVSSGTGLGLYITKHLIEAQKGKIWFESKENEGSTFYFSLPATVS